MKGNLLQIAVGVLATALVTGAASWIVFGQDKVTRSEMVDYVQTQAPWIRARGEIQSTLKMNSDQIKDLGKSVEKLVDAQLELVVEQRVLVTRFDSYLKGKEKER